MWTEAVQMSNISVCRDISALSPNAQKACRLFMDRCKAAGYDIFITETYRSQERQEYLYSLGRTRPGSKVTWTHNSRHMSRRAWDIATHGGALYDKAVLQACGAIAKTLGIIWGGTWSTPDTPHFEISVNWTAPEGAETEDEPMTEAEKAKMQAIDESLSNVYKILNEKVMPAIEAKNKVYNTIDEVPLWYRPTVQKLIDKGALHGDENGKLNLTEDMVRVLVVLDRVGVY